MEKIIYQGSHRMGIACNWSRWILLGFVLLLGGLWICTLKILKGHFPGFREVSFIKSLRTERKRREVDEAPQILRRPAEAESLC